MTVALVLAARPDAGLRGQLAALGVRQVDAAERTGPGLLTVAAAARAAAATVSRPGPDRSAASTRRTPRAASWPRSPASGRAASTRATVMRVLPATAAVTHALKLSIALLKVAGS